jgi:hypothetical protein
MYWIRYNPALRFTLELPILISVPDLTAVQLIEKKFVEACHQYGFQREFKARYKANRKAVSLTSLTHNLIPVMKSDILKKGEGLSEWSALPLHQDRSAECLDAL